MNKPETFIECTTVDERADFLGLRIVEGTPSWEFRGGFNEPIPTYEIRSKGERTGNETVYLVQPWLREYEIPAFLLGYFRALEAEGLKKFEDS